MSKKTSQVSKKTGALGIGDRFFEWHQFDRAIGEWENPLQLDKANIDSH